MAKDRTFFFYIFLKGMLMGICDIIPGISGGTIAFITGIYERLINAIRGLSLKMVIDFARANVNFLRRPTTDNFMNIADIIKGYDLIFLGILLGGITTSLLLTSRIMAFLLDNYFAYTISFFIGLIIASSKIIFDNIRDHKIENILFGIIGLLLGISLLMVTPLSITPNLPYLLICGLLGTSAMFLPGISGAFILLILGVYEFMVKALHNPIHNLLSISAFMIGVIIGAFLISRIISFLFKKDRCKTLYLLLGLVIGALSIPVRKVVETTILDIHNILISIFFIIIGGIIAAKVGSLQEPNRLAR